MGLRTWTVLFSSCLSCFRLKSSLYLTCSLSVSAALVELHCKGFLGSSPYYICSDNGEMEIEWPLFLNSMEMNIVIMSIGVLGLPSDSENEYWFLTHEPRHSKAERCYFGCPFVFFAMICGIWCSFGRERLKFDSVIW